MEEIDLKELIEMFWSRKNQIILTVVIFVIIGIIYTIGFVTPEYTSSTTLVLATDSSGNSEKTTNKDSLTITTTDVTLNSKLVSTYSELLKSKNVIRQVISNLGIDVDEETLRKSVTVSSVKDTELIEISVTSENATYATKIANEIAKVFSDKVSEIYNINNVHVVDYAELSDEPSNINHPKDVLVFTFIGLVIAMAYVLLINMLDTTIKSTVNFEKEFGVPVLASIPLYEYDVKKGGGRR